MSDRLFLFVKAHGWVFVIAVFVGLIYGSHHLFIQNILEESGETYYPVTIQSNYDEAITYGPRAKAAHDGNFLNGDFNLYEYKDETIATLPVLNPILMGGLGHITGSLNRAFIFADFIFPLLIFIALYALFFELVKNRLGAIVVAVIFIFAPKLALYVPPTSFDSLRFLFEDTIGVFFNPDPQGLYFSRFEYPQVTYLFYVLALYFSLRAIIREERLGAILGGVSFGILFYSYFYDWMYILVALGIIVVLLVLKKEWVRVRLLSVIFCIGFFISGFYWFNYFELSELAQYKDIVLRLGVEESHLFRFDTWTTYLRTVVLAFFVWFALRRHEHTRALYVVGFLFSMFAVLNLHVITGFNPQPDHWHREQFLPIYMAIVLLLWWGIEYIRRKTHCVSQRLLRFSGVALIMCILITQAFSQYRFSTLTAQAHVIDPAHEESYEWINENVPGGSVILSISPETNTELQLHANNFLFLPNGLNTMAPHEELWGRLLTASSFYYVPLDWFEGMLSRGKPMLAYLFHSYYHGRELGSYFNGDIEREISPEEIQKRIKEYHELLLSKDPFSSPYRLDYIFVGPREEVFGQGLSDHLRSFEKVYEKNGIHVYKNVKL